MNLINTNEAQKYKGCKAIHSNRKTSGNCFSCSVEKLLINMSNKLGLSSAIYQK